MKRRMCIAAVATLSLATAGAASSAGGGSQFVGATPVPQFGAALGPDGSVRGSSSTIAVSVTRSVENGVPVVTIAPRD